MSMPDSLAADLIPIRSAVELWSGINPLPAARFDSIVTASGFLRLRGYLVIGGTLIGHAKASNRWHLSESDLRRAAASLAPLVGNAESPVTIGRRGPGWRTKLAADLDRNGEFGYFPRPDWGFLSLPDVCEQVGGTWKIPAAYVSILDNAARAATDAGRAAGKCGTCGTRKATEEINTPRGWVRLCPACYREPAGRLRDYSGELSGVRYSKRNLAGARALDYRCAACGTQAACWDHCHDHGYVRGPLCTSCNRHDGASQKSIRPAVEHLWRCPDCHRKRSIPTATRAKVIMAADLIGRLITHRGNTPCPPALRLCWPDEITVANALRERRALTIEWTCATCCDGPRKQPVSPLELDALDRTALSWLTGDRPWWSIPGTSPTRRNGPA